MSPDLLRLQYALKRLQRNPSPATLTQVREAAKRCKSL